MNSFLRNGELIINRKAGKMLVKRENPTTHISREV